MHSKPLNLSGVPLHKLSKRIFDVLMLFSCPI